MLRKIYGPMAEEVTQDWGKLHVEGLYNLCSSLNIFWAIKSNRMRLSVTCGVYGRQEKCMCTGIWWGENERDHMEDLGVEGGNC
jgi:hypothetical protein